MKLGIRLHDVNSSLTEDCRSMGSRCETARAEGFSCIHLAYAKVIKNFSPAELTAELGDYTRRLLRENGLELAVLGCYLNLANPDPVKLAEIKSRYYAHIALAPAAGACVVGTETGAPNAEYRLDANTHTDKALYTFMHNLEDVVDRAESCGVTVAIEPVWNHIVYNADRAAEVLRGIASPNLRIILDPVNLLCTENADDREYVFRDAIDKLGDKVAVVHLKDFVRRDGKLVSVAAGTGEMQYDTVLRFMKERKPYIHATLENTVNENAVRAREFIREAYDSI